MCGADRFSPVAWNWEHLLGDLDKQESHPHSIYSPLPFFGTQAMTQRWEFQPKQQNDEGTLSFQLCLGESRGRCRMQVRQRGLLASCRNPLAGKGLSYPPGKPRELH